MSALEFREPKQWLSLSEPQRVLFAGYTAEQNLTVSQVRAQVAELATRLRQIPGHRAAVLPHEGAPFTIALLAALAAGKSAVLLPENTEPYVQAHQGCFDLLLSDRPYADLACPQCLLSSLTAESADPAGAAGSETELVFSDEAEIVFFTSGSTGLPRQVRKTLRTMVQESCLLFAGLADTVQDCTVIASVYPQHLYGLTFRVMLPLCFGLPTRSSLIHYSEELCALPHGNYLFVSSPVFLKHADTKLTAPDKVAVTVSAGGFLPSEAVAVAGSWLHSAVFEIYGSTETGVMGRRWRTQDKADTGFVPFPGVTFRQDKARPEDGAEQDAGWSVCSPLLPDAQPLALQDCLQFEADGTFVPQGRCDSIVKIDEKRISLTAVRSCLLACPEVADAEVITYTQGSRVFIGAAVILRPEYVQSLQLSLSLKERVAAQLGAKARPRRIVFTEAFPENHMGKRLNAKIKEMFHAAAVA